MTDNSVYYRNLGKLTEADKFYVLYMANTNARNDVDGFITDFLQEKNREDA